MDMWAICWKRQYSKISIEIVKFGADLSGIIGLVHVDFAGFSMYIQAGYTKIGCQYQSNEEWDQMDIRTALELGIEREHFEVYHAFYKAAMLILKEQTVSE